MKYRKKQIEIEAWQYIPNDRDDTVGTPQWMVDAMLSRKIEISDDSDDRNLYINTLEGKMTASPGDYIIKGIEGELYPCKPSIFEQTYEKVE